MVLELQECCSDRRSTHSHAYENRDNIHQLILGSFGNTLNNTAFAKQISSISMPTKCAALGKSKTIK